MRRPKWRALLRRLAYRLGVDVDREPSDTVYGVLHQASAARIRDYCRSKWLTEQEFTALQAIHPVAASSKSARAFAKALDAFPEETLEALPFALDRQREVRLERQLALRDRMSAYLAGKCVALTGPATHGLDAAFGQEIEACDVVVRLNFQWPIPSPLTQHLGSRCDLLYHCCNGDYPLDSLFVPAFAKLRFVLLENGVHSRQLSRHCEASGVPYDFLFGRYRHLTRRIGSPPTTGLVAIDHLLDFDVRELRTYGMTFGLTPYYGGYSGHGALAHSTGRQPWKHVPANEVLYVNKLRRSDPRLVLDPIAARTLDQTEV